MSSGIAWQEGGVRLAARGAIASIGGGLVATALVLLSVLHFALAAEAAYSFRSPFHPQQCDHAVAAGQRLLQRAPTSEARVLLAEGLLCRGLDEDDPWALEEAIEMFRRVLADEPGSFFALLDLADALRGRFPLSEEARTAMIRVRDALGNADVGDARESLAEYIDDNLATFADQRRHALPLLQTWAAALAADSLSSADIPGFVSLLAQTGPEGLRRAEDGLDRYLAMGRDDTLVTFYRAEISRGRATPERLRLMYEQIAARSCGSDPSTQAAQCSVARLRLSQLRRLTNRRESAQSARNG
jgi:tetratricopeptide (TPR) repeat protein